MSLPNYLSQIKSAGIYRFVFDKSQMPDAEAETLRLVVGYSQKGPFNTPVYVKNPEDFKKIYGGISKKLERNGIFFHRLALQALAGGPILCLNLKPLDDETVEYVSFDNTTSFVSTESAEGTDYKFEKEIPVKDIYDISRFWALDPEKLIDKTDKYISITATDEDKSSNTVFVRSFVPTGYNITFQDWYSKNTNGDEMPEFLLGHENERVQDYFAEVYVFRGKITRQLATTEGLSKYFDVVGEEVYLKPFLLNGFGEKIDTLQALAEDSNSNFINSYSGILIPEFKNSNNSIISLNAQFNADQDTHKMMMSFNSDGLYDGTIELSALSTTGFSNIGSISYTEPTEETETAFGWGEEEQKRAEDEAADVLSRYIEATGATGTKVNVDAVYTGITFNGESIAEAILTAEEMAPADIMTAIYDYVQANAVEGMNVVKVAYATGEESVYNISKQVIVKKLGGVEVEMNVPYLYSNSAIVPTSVVAQYADDAWEFETYNGVKDASIYAYITDEITAEDGELSFPESFKDVAISVGDKFFNNGIYTVISVKKNDDNTKTIVAVNEDGEPMEAPETALFVLNHSIGDICYEKSFKGTYLKGYEYNGDYDSWIEGTSFNKGSMYSKLKWHDYIINCLKDYKGIRLALTSRVDLDYRYLVDTFEAYPSAEIHSQLALITKEKDNAMAILNFPSVKNLAKCDYTSFTNKAGEFEAKYIADGGNKQKPMGEKLTLVSEISGASYATYNTCILIDENGVKKAIPSAGAVSNTFMAKYTNAFPYTIVAGPNRGKIYADNLIGPDFNWSRADLDILEPFGVNAIVYVPGKGVYINSNKTAKKDPITALSAINVREVVIYLQDEIEKIMQTYQWEFNTPELRSNIKTLADKKCSEIQANGGIYDYRNVCDESNNTDEVIDNEMLVLDTAIEPGRGAGKMVQKLTIYRKGGIKAVYSE